MTTRELRQPAFAKEVRAFIAAGEDANIHAHVGREAWDRAKFRGPGHRLVVPLDHETAPEDFDFTVLQGLDITLNAIDADLVLARRVATKMCEHGARMVVMLHPALDRYSEFFYGVRS